jgi:hypothetical protein
MSAFEGIATVGAARLDLEIVEAVGFCGRAAQPVGPPAMPTCERSIGTAARRDGPYARGVVPILPADKRSVRKRQRPVGSARGNDPVQNDYIGAFKSMGQTPRGRMN